MRHTLRHRCSRTPRHSPPGAVDVMGEVQYENLELAQRVAELEGALTDVRVCV